jgi:lipopolysaccharide/colanic/teichoic acid biosynthesis glycosyltransferase
MPEPITIISVGGGLTGLTVHMARRHFEMAKEVVDVVLSAVALILAAPVLLVCAAMIKLSDRGPVFYVQTRLGRNGRPFRMVKLRTMYQDAESRSGAQWAQDKDPRVIPLCRWMRKSHVDELPQLINVIRGEMSLVGPRPERPEIMQDLEAHYPNIRERLAVRPGITGLAQIRAGYDTTVENFKHKLSADLEYIRTRCWRLELKILAMTFSKFRDRQAH